MVAIPRTAAKEPATNEVKLFDLVSANNQITYVARVVTLGEGN